MTDKPTDAEIDAFVQVCREKGMWELAIFQAVLAKWGTPPAVAGEPVAYLQKHKHSGMVELSLRRMADNDFNRTRWECIPLYTTPQPTQAQAGAVPLSDEIVDSLCKVGAVYAPDGNVTRTPAQYRDELEAAQRHGLRKGERAHGIKGGQHGL